MIIKVPKTIKAGGHTYTILFSTELNDRNEWGATNHRTQIIEINMTRPVSQVATSLIHEVLHCVNHVYYGSQLEVRGIEQFSEGLYQILEQLGIELDWCDISTLEAPE